MILTGTSSVGSDVLKVEASVTQAEWNLLIASSSGFTGAAAAFTDLTTSLAFRPSTAVDRDFDGLPDDIEFAIGTVSNKSDTDNDGLSDFIEIEQGLDPLGGQGFPTGIIASLPLLGEANSE